MSNLFVLLLLTTNLTCDLLFQSSLSLSLLHLFQFFLEHPERLPENYQEEAHYQPLHRLVCDYIAGMTDRFAMREHERLTGRRVLDAAA